MISSTLFAVETDDIGLQMIVRQEIALPLVTDSVGLRASWMTSDVGPKLTSLPDDQSAFSQSRFVGLIICSYSVYIHMEASVGCR